MDVIPVPAPAEGTDQQVDIRSDIRPGRQRVKRACQPCKSRKKRCDGAEPCATCIRYGGPKDSNWGKAFATKLALKLDAGKVGKPMLAWNLGLKDEQPYAQPPITRIITQAEMERLANHYFNTTHQIFGMFRRELLEQKIRERWGENLNLSDPHDPILCGIAAMGSLFSGGNPTPMEASLVECARSTLETTSVLNYPSRHHVVAWVLRTTYLRCSANPHAAWLASCTTMHIIESVGMDDDGDVDSDDLSKGIGCGVLNMHRSFWMAKVMNAWIANDYGRSKVTVKIPTPPFPTPVDALDITLDFVQLFEISDQLDHDVSHSAAEFEAGIAQVYNFRARSYGATLSQTNLCLGLYRRLRLLATSISDTTVKQVIELGCRGLDSVMHMVSQHLPWWHVANVPFQFVCVLLAMDTKEALSHIGDALETLEAVARCFATRSLLEALSTARTLVELSQKKKQEEINILGQGLRNHNDDMLDQQQQTMNGKQLVQQPVANMNAGPLPNLNSTDFSNFDWDAFLSMDIPVLEAAVAI
ncbi:hypothetical protein CJF30_00001941 [Rutstroemia sp. NJR-2017a BBW]|nr:hypothetical protein CJF30_00001941 [Rutstroemia sp. NJR-2017a BBW]